MITWTECTAVSGGLWTDSTQTSSGFLSAGSSESSRVLRSAFPTVARSLVNCCNLCELACSLDFCTKTWRYKASLLFCKETKLICISVFVLKEFCTVLYVCYSCESRAVYLYRNCRICFSTLRYNTAIQNHVGYINAIWLRSVLQGLFSFDVYKARIEECFGVSYSFACSIRLRYFL